MKVLVACEESQEVCKAFRELGHEAFSCDILPCSGGHPEWHIKADISRVLKNSDSWHGKKDSINFETSDETYHILDENGWDIIIAFPPCTHLACSGAKHFKQKIKDGRQQQGINFFMLFANAKCEKIAIENPVGIMSTRWRKPDQIIQPYQFGHEARKRTCLWLKNLPKLIPTKIVDEGEDYISPSGKKLPKWYGDPVDKNGRKIPYNSEEIKILRSKTFPGIAKAMAEQWGIASSDVSTKSEEKK